MVSQSRSGFISRVEARSILIDQRLSPTQFRLRRPDDFVYMIHLGQESGTIAYATPSPRRERSSAQCFAARPQVELVASRSCTSPGRSPSCVARIGTL